MKNIYKSNSLEKEKLKLEIALLKKPQKQILLKLRVIFTFLTFIITALIAIFSISLFKNQNAIIDSKGILLESKTKLLQAEKVKLEYDISKFTDKRDSLINSNKKIILDYSYMSDSLNKFKVDFEKLHFNYDGLSVNLEKKETEYQQLENKLISISSKIKTLNRNKFDVNSKITDVSNNTLSIYMSYWTNIRGARRIGEHIQLNTTFLNQLKVCQIDSVNLVKIENILSHYQKKYSENYNANHIKYEFNSRYGNYGPLEKGKVDLGLSINDTIDANYLKWLNSEYYNLVADAIEKERRRISLNNSFYYNISVEQRDSLTNISNEYFDRKINSYLN